MKKRYDLIIDCDPGLDDAAALLLALTSPKNITIVCTAPLTNVAMAIVKEPKIIPRIHQLIIMGGARDIGNMNPAAEFNFFVDPCC